MLLRALLGLLPATCWNKTIELSHTSSDALGHYVGILSVKKLAVKEIPELQYIMFHIGRPHKDTFVYNKRTRVHFSNVDSSVQVQYTYAGVFESFPALKKIYFVELLPIVFSIGDIRTVVLGLLENILICLGKNPFSTA